MNNNLFDKQLLIIVISISFLVIGVIRLRHAIKHPEKIYSTSGDDNSIVVVLTSVASILLSIELISYTFCNFSLFKWMFGL